MMRRFRLIRKEDPSGISGIGPVAEGVQFSNGKCALSWTTKYTSIALYDDIDTLRAIHGHNGATVVEWIDTPSMDNPTFTIQGPDGNILGQGLVDSIGQITIQGKNNIAYFEDSNLALEYIKSTFGADVKLRSYRHELHSKTSGRV